MSYDMDMRLETDDEKPCTCGHDPLSHTWLPEGACSVAGCECEAGLVV